MTTGAPATAQARPSSWRLLPWLSETSDEFLTVADLKVEQLEQDEAEVLIAELAGRG